MKKYKYYKEMYFDVPVVIYPKSNKVNLNVDEIADIINDKLKLPFEIDEEENDYIETNGEENSFYSSIIEKCNNKDLIFAGNLTFYFKGLIKEGELDEDYYFDIPPILLKKITSILTEITNDLDDFGLIIELAYANKDFYLSYPDNPDYLSLDDILILADKNAVLSTTEEIESLKENIDLNLIDSFLMTKDKKFVKGVKNIPKKKIEERFGELKKISLKKKDMAKFIEYYKNLIKILFLSEEERNKAVGFLTVFNISKEKNIKRTNLEIIRLH